MTKPKPPATNSAAPASATGPLRPVYSSFSTPEAYLVRGMLEDSGITCFLSNEMIAIVDSPVSFGTGGVKVLVQASDTDRAALLLRDWPASGDAPHAP